MESRKVAGALKNAWNNRNVATEAEMKKVKGKQVMYNGTVVPSVLHDSEIWEINAGMRKRVNVFEMIYPKPKKKELL